MCHHSIEVSMPVHAQNRPEILIEWWQIDCEASSGGWRW